MPRPTRLLAVVLLLAAVPACRSAAHPDAAATPPKPAGPPPPPFDVKDDRLDVESLTATLDGRTVALDPSANPVEVPTGARLGLTTWERLGDYRVRLVDSHDRLVRYRLESGPVAVRSKERPEPGGTWLRIDPEPALEVGESYALEIEGERADSVTDDRGRTYQDLVLPLVVTEPPAPPAEIPDGGSTPPVPAASQDGGAAPASGDGGE